jgi:Ca2+-transporting ATPase
MNRILKRRAIVRKLVAAETLGSVSTICVDKTGTLTEGKMRVVNTYLSDENMTKRALLATNHQVNAVEVSLQNWLENRLTAHDKVTFQQEEYLELKIFDSKTKFSATLGGENLYCVGAPEIVLAKTTLSAKQKEKWLEQFREFSLKGMRLVAVAYKSRADGDSDIPTTALPAGLTWLGLIVLEDPVRPNLFSVFKATADAGIAIKVITGDFGETAQAVLRKIGIEVDEIEMMSGRELGGLSDSQLAHQVTKIRLFYRTTPDQKLRIVNALQAQDEVVAMMGDGINDTPALKKADIGIVVDNATDFSKEVADIVLLDSNFQTIIAAVEEGRSIFENMRKVLAYLLADAFDAIVLVVGSLVIGLPTPMLPLQILYINFLADGLPDLALAFEKPEGAVMRDKPRPKKFPLLDREVKTLVFIIGIVITSLVFILYVFMLGQGLEIEFIRTFIFATVGIDSLFYVFSIKTFRRNIWKENFLNNRFLNIGVSIGILSMVAAVYVPFLQDILDTVAMPLWAWGVILLKSVLSILAIEVIKWKFMRNNI